jgi:DinB family protein
MGRKGLVGVAVGMMMILAQPETVDAQAQSWQEVQVADIEDMQNKFRQLAEAFDESDYSWRPMDGVRSVGGVLGLAIAEANLFPTGWGYDAPAAAASGFGPELERAGSLSKAAMIREIDASFAFLIAIVSGMTEEERMSDGSYFGRAMPVHASVATAMADMHEHLGQLIAYARTNHVVPPWSMGN